MANFLLEEYAPAGAIVLTQFRTDLNDFTNVFKHIDLAYLADFETALADLDQIASRYARDNEIADLTAQLYTKSDVVRDNIQILSAYLKSAKLDTKKATLAAKQFRARNIEAAVLETNQLIAYANQNSAKLEPYMPDNFIENLSRGLREVENLNNEQNKKLLARKEFTVANRAYYDNVYAFIAEVCRCGKIIYKQNPVKRDSYNLSKIKAQLNAANKPRKQKEE